MILESRFNKHLSLDNYSEYNDETLQKICKRSINNCHFLSTIPCFIDHENQLHEFWLSYIFKALFSNSKSIYEQYLFKKSLLYSSPMINFP